MDDSSGPGKILNLNYEYFEGIPLLNYHYQPPYQPQKSIGPGNLRVITPMPPPPGNKAKWRNFWGTIIKERKINNLPSFQSSKFRNSWIFPVGSGQGGTATGLSKTTIERAGCGWWLNIWIVCCRRLVVGFVYLDSYIHILLLSLEIIFANGTFFRFFYWNGVDWEDFF